MFHLWLWSPLYPFPEIPPPELHVSRQFSHVCVSLSSSYLLSARFSFICRLPSGAGCHPPSARTTDWRPVPCCPWCPGQCTDVWGFPPPPCTAGGTWLGCGWRGVGDDAPPMVLRSSMRLAIPNVPTEVSSALLTPLDRLGTRICRPPPPPPPPFPVQPYLSRYPPYQRESIFVVAPLALSLLVSPGSGP